MPKGTPFPRPVTGSAWHWTWSPTFLSSPSIYHSTEMSKRCFFLDFAQQRVLLSQSPWWVPVDSPHVLLASSILIKFQDSPPRSIPAEPHYKTVACQPPSMWVSPALGISEIWKIAHRLSPATATPPPLPLGLARCPPAPGLVQTHRPIMLASVLGGPEGNPAGGRNFWCSRLNLSSRVSQSRGGRGGGGGPIQPERRSPLQLAGHQNPHKTLPCGASPQPVSFTSN